MKGTMGREEMRGNPKFLGHPPLIRAFLIPDRTLRISISMLDMPRLQGLPGLQEEMTVLHHQIQTITTV